MDSRSYEGRVLFNALITNTLPPECEAFDLVTSCTLFSREATFGEHMLLSSYTIKLSTCFQKLLKRCNINLIDVLNVYLFIFWMWTGMREDKMLR